MGLGGPHRHHTLTTNTRWASGDQEHVTWGSVGDLFPSNFKFFFKDTYVLSEIVFYKNKRVAVKSMSQAFFIMFSFLFVRVFP